MIQLFKMKSQECLRKKLIPKGPSMSLNLLMGDSFSILYILFSYVYSK